MLTIDQVRRQRRRRPAPSLKQQYEEYVLQRIETFKNSLPRGDLLRLGDEAFAELQAAAESQLILTEVLVAECVDRMIMKRLRIASFRKWRGHFLDLRAAQRTPTHWGLDGAGPVARLLPRIEFGDQTVVVGAAGEPAAYLLAAHDAAVTFVAPDVQLVERVEQRMAEESLASMLTGAVANLGYWFPTLDRPADVVVIDASVLVDVDPALRQGFMDLLQRETAPGGVHVVIPGSPALAPDALLPFYQEWSRDTAARGKRGTRKATGLLLEKPMRHSDTNQDVSDEHTEGRTRA